MTEEQAERLRQIRERLRSEAFDPPSWKDVGFLLDLLDTQSQSSLSQLMTDEDERIAREQAALEAGGTRMRKACLGKVRDIGESYKQQAEHSNNDGKRRLAWMVTASSVIAAELESLTLDQVKPGEPLDTVQEKQK